MILVCDCETDGLYNEATKMHCLVAKVLGEDKWHKFHPDVYEHRTEVRNLFSNATRIIGHNFLEFDVWVLDKLGIAKRSVIEHKIIDTLVMSTVLNPDRPIPKGVSAKAGPHSVEAWSIRLRGKNEKVKNEDWSQFTPNMLARCESDVKLNEEIYYALTKEMGR